MRFRTDQHFYLYHKERSTPFINKYFFLQVKKLNLFKGEFFYTNQRNKLFITLKKDTVQILTKLEFFKKKIHYLASAHHVFFFKNVEDTLCSVSTSRLLHQECRRFIMQRRHITSSIHSYHLLMCNPLPSHVFPSSTKSIHLSCKSVPVQYNTSQVRVRPSAVYLQG